MGSIYFDNEMTDAEDERLSILVEELGESLQAIGKIKRHGYESGWNGSNNRNDLEKELGHVQFIIKMMGLNGDISLERMSLSMIEKSESIKPYLHFAHDVYPEFMSEFLNPHKPPT